MWLSIKRLQWISTVFLSTMAQRFLRSAQTVVQFHLIPSRGSILSFVIEVDIIV